MLTTKQELDIWRLLTHFWGYLTAIFFLLDFFKVLDLSEVLTSVVFIYIAVLSLFTTTKEFERWKSNSYISNHKGEFFVVIWTILVIVFVGLTAFKPNLYSIPGEFTATYLGILGIFAISRKSRYLRKLKNDPTVKKAGQRKANNK